MGIFKIDDLYYDSIRHIITKNYECASDISEDLDVHNRSRLVTGAYFILTNTCNLNCVYCFAKRNRKQDQLLLDTAKPLIYEIVKNSSLCQCFGNACVVPYFKFSGGGEPTLNFSSMKQITSFAKEILHTNGLSAEFHLATNGQWNDNRLSEWINANITHLLFSVDGGEVVNNTHRPRIDKNNGYSILINNLQQITNSKIKITFRMTVSNYSLPYLEDSVFTFRKLGIKNVQIEPLMPFEVKKNIFEPDPEMFAKQYSFVKRKYSDMNIFSSFDVFNNEDNCPCGHQIGNTVSLFPDGTVSSCPERASVGEADFIRGRIENGKMVLSNCVSMKSQKHFARCEDCIVAGKCDLCISKVKLFHDKNYDTGYLCKIYKVIFEENVRQLIDESSISQYQSAIYDIDASIFIFAQKDSEGL